MNKKLTEGKDAFNDNRLQKLNVQELTLRVYLRSAATSNSTKYCLLTLSKAVTRQEKPLCSTLTDEQNLECQ